MDLGNAIFSEHATGQLAKRGITLEAVRAVLAGAEDVMELRPGRVVAQGMVGQHLLRVFVDVDRQPPEVVTAYLTSKISKYRRLP